MKDALLSLLTAERTAKRPVALVTALAGGAQAVLFDDPSRPPQGDLDLDGETRSFALGALAADRSTTLGEGPERLFIQAFNPPLRLLIVGAVHIAQPLIPMARLLGFEPILIDPRDAWATEARFPEVQIIRDWPDEALQALALDGRTAIVTLTHDPKLDDPALQVALPSPAFYVGALGSKRTHAKRVERLTEDGMAAETLGRLHAPIGLPLGARAPSEIALSIMAEIVEHKHARAAAIANGAVIPTLAANKRAASAI